MELWPGRTRGQEPCYNRGDIVGYTHTQALKQHDLPRQSMSKPLTVSSSSYGTVQTQDIPYSLPRRGGPVPTGSCINAPPPGPPLPWAISVPFQRALITKRTIQNGSCVAATGRMKQTLYAQPSKRCQHLSQPPPEATHDVT